MGIVAATKICLMTTLLTAIGLLIAAFGALIAYFQWRTAHQRIVLDLFERRTGVFEEIENAVKQALNSANREEADAAFWRFVSAESKARFLFGVEVIEELKTRRVDLSAIRSFIDVQSHREKQRMLEREGQARRDLVEFIESSSTLFASYVRLDQKMPSLWWPF